VQIKGLVKTSVVDYPGEVATVLFVGGCNFRCPYCHNVDLVLRPESLPDIGVGEVLRLLAERQGFVDGVVITGGEPTLQSDLIPFLRRGREQGLHIKLDTNGYRPDVLSALLSEGLVDYVAVDIKAPPAKYSLLAGRADLDVGRVEQSIAVLRGSDLPHEFRTTVVPGLLVEEDVEEIARWIAGAERYVLQQFRPVRTLDPALKVVTPYPAERLRAMAERASRWVAWVSARGG